MVVKKQRKSAKQCKSAQLPWYHTIRLSCCIFLFFCPFFLFDWQSESQSVSRKVGTSYGAALNLFADLPPGGTISNFIEFCRFHWMLVLSLDGATYVSFTSSRLHLIVQTSSYANENIYKIYLKHWDKYILQIETNTFCTLRQIHGVWDKYISQFDTNTIHNCYQQLPTTTNQYKPLSTIISHY